MDKLNLSREQTNNLLLEYFIISGSKRAAECFSEESGVRRAQSVDNIEIRMRIQHMVVNGEIAEAINGLNALNPDILLNDEELLFQLRQQQFIDILTNEGALNAVEFARSVLTPIIVKSESLKQEMEKTISLIIFPRYESECFPAELQPYLKPGRREVIASNVNKAILRSLNLGTEPKLNQLINILESKQRTVGSKIPGFVPLTGLSKKENT
jgi:hypothetical protein